MSRQKNIFLLLFAPTILRTYQLGIENSDNRLMQYKNKPIALVVNAASLTHSGIPSHTYLQKQGFNIRYLLAPEHGISGTIRAGDPVPHSTDKKNNTPIISLYRGNDQDEMIPQDVRHHSAALFFDLPHCGMRHYTYISTLYRLLEYCAKYTLPIVVFDRPTPLGPRMEGPLVDQALYSFISIAPIPLRYGLSMGELAHYFNHLLKKPAPLTVIPLRNYRRTDQIPPLDAPLSPNIPTSTACYGYSFLGLMEEIVPFFSGSGTNKPFNAIYVPEKNNLSRTQWHEIALFLEKQHITSTYTRVYRTKNKTWYMGLKLDIKNITRTNTFELLLFILKKCAEFGVPLKFNPAFDKAVGTAAVREYIQGTVSYKQIMRTVNTNLQQFSQQIHKYLLYEPAPTVILLPHTLTPVQQHTPNDRIVPTRQENRR